MHHHILQLFETYGYWGLFIGLALEYLFIPIPGETTLVTVGFLWQKNPAHWSLPLLIVSTTFGTFTGSVFGYGVGRVLGRPFLERFGRYIRLTPERIDKADALFARYTIPTLIFSRYIAGVRIIVPYIAGINRVPLWRYLPVIFVGSLLWTTSFIVAGNIIERAWHQFMLHWRQELVPAILIVVAAIVGYWYLHKWIKSKMDGPAHSTKDAADEPKD